MWVDYNWFYHLTLFDEDIPQLPAESFFLTSEGVNHYRFCIPSLLTGYTWMVVTQKHNGQTLPDHTGRSGPYLPKQEAIPTWVELTNDQQTRLQYLFLDHCGCCHRVSWLGAEITWLKLYIWFACMYIHISLGLLHTHFVFVSILGDWPSPPHSIHIMDIALCFFTVPIAVLIYIRWGINSFCSSSATAHYISWSLGANKRLQNIPFNGISVSSLSDPELVPLGLTTGGVPE